MLNQLMHEAARMEAWVQDLKESHQTEKPACVRKFLSWRKTRLVVQLKEV